VIFIEQKIEHVGDKASDLGGVVEVLNLGRVPLFHMFDDGVFNCRVKRRAIGEIKILLHSRLRNS
jgi:hypothetical protein